MTAPDIKTLRLDAIERILGTRPDEYGIAPCPGAHLHSTKDGNRDFRIHGLESHEPHGHCFHAKCAGLVHEFNEKLKDALILVGANVWLDADTEVPRERVRGRRRGVTMDEEALKAISRGILTDEPDVFAWLEKHSPASCDGIHGYLKGLYPNPGERVVIFSREQSQGQLLWDADVTPTWELGFRTGCTQGVWFLIQPVNGQFVKSSRLRTKHNPEGKSRRCEECVTEFRYLLLESDTVDLQSWGRVLIQLPFPVVSVVSSGSRSIHALLHVGASTRKEWEEFRWNIEGVVAKYGSDPASMKAVQLSRLPGCLRHGRFNKELGSVELFQAPQLQRLWYYAPDARGTQSILERNS